MTTRLDTMLTQVDRYLLTVGAPESERLRLIEAMQVADRRFFDPHPDCYENTAHPIEREQTISQPVTVARILQLAAISPGDRVLDVGCGSGWNAALCSLLCGPDGAVIALDRHDALCRRARENIDHWLETGPAAADITILPRNWAALEKGKQNTRFDRIALSAGFRQEQDAFLERALRSQGRDGCRLVAPRTRGPISVWDLIDGQVHTRDTPESYRFVPLILDR